MQLVSDRLLAILMYLDDFEEQYFLSCTLGGVEERKEARKKAKEIKHLLAIEITDLYTDFRLAKESKTEVQK